MKSKKYIHLLYLLIVVNYANAQKKQFVFTANCINAYNAFMSLKVQEGNAFLVKEITSNPNNALPVMLQNYSDFVTLTFNDNQALFTIQKKAKEKRLDYIEDADENSPYYLFAKAIIHFQWSVIRAKYKDYWNAAWEFRKANMLLKENEKKFPNFIYNKIYIGVQQSIIGTIPDGYKWLSSFLGLKGSVVQGINNLQYCMQAKDNLQREETIFYYTYIKAYIENKPEEAIKNAESYKLNLTTNHLLCFMMANIYLNNKKPEKCELLINNRIKNASYMNLPMFEYELGCAKLDRLDNECIPHFINYLNTFGGNFYKKDACLKIALSYYLQNNMSKAKEYIAKIKTIGNTETDADKYAATFNENNAWSNKELLKARILADGGYLKNALSIMQKIDKNMLKTTLENIEYEYRFARIYDELKENDKALIYYVSAMEKGKNDKSYFAARSSLQTAMIYEKKGNKVLAVQYYNAVLTFKNTEYKNSLDQKAKAALNRLAN